LRPDHRDVLTRCGVPRQHLTCHDGDPIGVQGCQRTAGGWLPRESPSIFAKIPNCPRWWRRWQCTSSLIAQALTTSIADKANGAGAPSGFEVPSQAEFDIAGDVRDARVLLG